MLTFNHYSVMLKEAIDGLNVNHGVYVDCTAGGGGNSLEILKRLKSGILVAIDQDENAIREIEIRLKDYSDKVIAVKDNFVNIDSILDKYEIIEISGAIVDLGVSSFQLDNAERGFSYQADAPLDMRMDSSSHLTARDVVNNYSEQNLKKIFYEYGEEQFAPLISKAIIEFRKEKPIETTLELVNIIKSALPTRELERKHHPAKKTFQAIRIEVNNELYVIQPTINSIIKRLASGGRLSVITFHSLEDRIVKNAFSELSKGCICPRDFPVCVCGRKPIIKVITKKPILPSDEELEINPRSRSAKLRIIEKI